MSTSTTTPTEIRAAMVSLLENLTPSVMAHSEDRWRFVDQAGKDEDATYPDRVFDLEALTPSTTPALFSCDLDDVGWTLTVYYQDVSGVSDRVLEDSRVISRTLRGLHHVIPGVQEIQVEPQALLYRPRQIVVQWAVLCRYRCLI